MLDVILNNFEIMNFFWLGDLKPLRINEFNLEKKYSYCLLLDAYTIPAKMQMYFIYYPHMA